MVRLCRLSIVLVICAASAAHADEPKVVKDAKEAAEWIATALSSSGYKADFTLESLKEIDRGELTASNFPAAARQLPTRADDLVLEGLKGRRSRGRRVQPRRLPLETTLEPLAEHAVSRPVVTIRLPQA